MLMRSPGKASGQRPLTSPSVSEWHGSLGLSGDGLAARQLLMVERQQVDEAVD